MDSIIGKSTSQLDTPCLVLDKKLLQENIKTLQQEADLAKKQVRPHVKTHKCLAICQQQIKMGAIGISAAKVSEALVLSEHGIKNTLITSPVITDIKIEKLMRCLLHDTHLSVVVDNLDNAKMLNAAANSMNLPLNILIDVDPGVGRTGVAYHEVIDFAHHLKSFSSLNLIGIQCYAGNLQHIQDYQERYKASTETMQKAAKALHQLNEAGFNCSILTGSGTGTYGIDLQIPEVTEIQPGSYTVMDAEYHLIGKKFKPAMTLLTTIISVNHGSHVTCDAGWKALYEVPTKPLVLKPEGYQYSWFGDEHGKIEPIDSMTKTLPKLGDRLELMVSHCDPTINMYDSFYVLEDDRVVDIWPIEMRGKSQ